MECDVLVIGAGILGLSSAYYLKKENPGKKVVVIACSSLTKSTTQARRRPGIGSGAGVWR